MCPTAAARDTTQNAVKTVGSDSSSSLRPWVNLWFGLTDPAGPLLFANAYGAAIGIVLHEHFRLSATINTSTYDKLGSDPLIQHVQGRAVRMSVVASAFFRNLYLMGGLSASHVRADSAWFTHPPGNAITSYPGFVMWCPGVEYGIGLEIDWFFVEVILQPAFSRVRANNDYEYLPHGWSYRLGFHVQ